MDVTDAELLSHLQDIDEYAFESFIAELWEKQGWDTTVTSGSNDGGVDIIAEKDMPFYQKQLIQAKRYSSGTKVGGPDIQQYSSLKHQRDDVDTVVVVTTSQFTKQAQETASNLNVKTIDGNRLVAVIKHVDAAGLVSKYATEGQTDEFDQTHAAKDTKGDVVETLRECIELSQAESGHVQSRVFVNGSQAGYSIHPQHPSGVYNMHGFVNASNTIASFGKDDWKHIEAIAHNNDLEVIDAGTKHGGYMYIGREHGHMPDTDEITQVLSESLSRVFSDSTHSVGITNVKY
ncbi:restriction endonuclease [Haloarcula laminariae]|uniref:restriction endonuclease n=1 Tax=Haloarcula laminariae TaxID=2961577 RepID=UPI0021CA0EAA|nr:restriction endonuclease [Halomicroarcula laminariae]